MALPIAAAPIAKMFLDAIGLSIAGLAAKDIVDVANKYIEDNPKESVMILKTLVPNLGIGEIFMKKGKDEEVEEEVDIEDMDPRDLTDAEKRKIMRDTAKSGGDVREKMKEAYEKFIKPGQDRTFEEAEERYEGGLEDVKKPPFDYKRFFRKADGGAIGVESLFEERTPFRFGGRGYQGGRNTGVSRGGGRSAAMGMGGKQRGGTFSAPTPTGGGGPSGGGSTKKVSPIKKIGGAIDKTLSVISPFVDPSSRFGKGLGIYNVLKKGAQTIGNTLFTPAGAAEMTLEDLKNLGAVEKGFFGDKLTDKGKALEEFRETATKFKFSKNPAKTPQAALDFITDPARTGLYGKSDIVKEKDFIQSAIDKGFLAEEKDYGLQKPLDEYLADGGRVGFNVGGITDPAALAIYNSMNAYGFSDQEIADAITAQGYDAGTLGQGATIGKPIPVAPEPSEGIIGIDLQERGGGFNPFGPLDETFTREAGSKPSLSKDALFGLGRFLQGKERGTLGTRLANQPRLPLPASIASYSLSPFNPKSKNYNPNIIGELNYLEGQKGLIGRDPNTYGLKYGPESVLAGKNVISMFGTNSYQQALEDYISDLEEKGTVDGVFNISNLKKGSQTRYNKALKEIQNYYSNTAGTFGVTPDKVRDILKSAKTQGISTAAAAAQQEAIDKQGRESAPGRGDAGNPGGSSGAMTDDNAGTFCFDPNTLVQMADGSKKKIKEIQLGDQTKGGEVTGVFQFKASDEIHDYKGVVVAGSHYVKEDGKFIMVQDSPISVKIDKIPVVYSLDTTGRRIFINDIEFADYNGDGVAKNFLTNAGVDLTGFDTEVLRQVENRLI